VRSLLTIQLQTKNAIPNLLIQQITGDLAETHGKTKVESMETACRNWQLLNLLVILYLNGII